MSVKLHIMGDRAITFENKAGEMLCDLLAAEHVNTEGFDVLVNGDKVTPADYELEDGDKITLAKRVQGGR